MDRLSSMSDALLCFILSKLPLREAVKCSVLSKRWRYLRAYLYILKFSPYNLLPISSLAHPNAIRFAECIVNDMMFFHTSPLQTFGICYDDCPLISPPSPEVVRCFSTASVWRWVQWAAFKDVEEIILKDNSKCTCGVHPQMLPPSLFSCRLLRALHLEFYSLVQFRASSHGLHFLTTCTLTSVELSDDSFERFVTSCPNLGNLDVQSSYGLHSPKISAPNLRHLCLRLIKRAYLLTAECPQLVGIQLDNFHGLIINTKRLLPLNGGLVKATLLCGNDLTSFELDVSRCAYDSTSVFWIIERISTFRALTRLSLHGGTDLSKAHGNLRGFKADGNLLSFFGRLHELEHLSIHGAFVKHLASSEIPLQMGFPLYKLEKVQIDLEELCGIKLLSWILRSSPKLQIMTLTLPTMAEIECKLQFLNDLLSLKRASPAARIIVQ